MHSLCLFCLCLLTRRYASGADVVSLGRVMTVSRISPAVQCCIRTAVSCLGDHDSLWLVTEGYCRPEERFAPR